MIVFSVIVFLVIIPLFGKISTSSQELLQLRSQLLRIEHAPLDLSRLERDMENYSPLEGRLKNSTLNQENLPDFFVLLEDVSKKMRLVYNIQIVSTDANYMNFQINLAGKSADVVRFIYSLENMPFFNQIARWDITKAQSVNSVPLHYATTSDVTANVLLRVNYKAQ